MNSHSEASPRAAFDILLAIVLVVAVYFASKALRTNLPAPEGKAWLWPVALITLGVTYKVTRQRDLAAYKWVLAYGIIALVGQAAVQIIYALAS